MRGLGHAIRPPVLSTLMRLPAFSLAALLWLMSRSATLRDLGKLGAAEPRMLIDMMAAAAPGKTPTLQSIRP